MNFYNIVLCYAGYTINDFGDALNDLNTHLNSDNIATYSLLIAAISLLFAVMSYWFEQIIKYKKNNGIKRILNIELKSIYIGVRNDIIGWEVSKEHRNKVAFIQTAHSYEILKYVIESGKVIDFFKDEREIACILHINKLLSLIEQFKPLLPQVHEPALDFFLEERLFKLREALLDLSSYDNFIDLQIVLEDIGAPEAEKKASAILTKFLPDKTCREL